MRRPFEFTKLNYNQFLDLMLFLYRTIFSCNYHKTVMQKSFCETSVLQPFLWMRYNGKLRAIQM